MNEIVKREPKNEIVVYQPNETMRLEVLVENETVWHIGASLKDAGSALFAMMKMELDPAVILGLLP